MDQTETMGEKLTGLAPYRWADRLAGPNVGTFRAPIDFLMISSPMGTFTPTASGAIATVMWECCRVTQRRGLLPHVLARECLHPCYQDVPSTLVEYPKIPSPGLALRMWRLQRRIAGWTHLRQGLYARRISHLIRRNGWDEVPWIISNDPELAVYLRQEFPSAFILHWFHNQLECKPAAREAFGMAVNAVAGVSDFTSRWVEEYYNIPLGGVQTVYNAVDAERFRPAEKELPGKVVINFVGRTGVEKGPDILLNAALVLVRKTRAFSVQLIGSNHWGAVVSDEYQSQLQRLIAQLVASGIDVRCTGHVDRWRLPDEIRRAHIHVVPSRWDEPFGLTTLEGMASGLATVASRTGGTPEVVGNAGLLFKRDDVEELATHLENLVCDPHLRRSLGACACQRARCFTWERAWSALESMIAF